MTEGSAGKGHPEAVTTRLRPKMARVRDLGDVLGLLPFLIVAATDERQEATP